MISHLKRTIRYKELCKSVDFLGKFFCSQIARFVIPTTVSQYTFHPRLSDRLTFREQVKRRRRKRRRKKNKNELNYKACKYDGAKTSVKPEEERPSANFFFLSLLSLVLWKNVGQFWANERLTLRKPRNKEEQLRMRACIFVCVCASARTTVTFRPKFSRLLEKGERNRNTANDGVTRPWHSTATSGPGYYIACQCCWDVVLYLLIIAAGLILCEVKELFEHCAC